MYLKSSPQSQASSLRWSYTARHCSASRGRTATHRCGRGVERLRGGADLLAPCTALTECGGKHSALHCSTEPVVALVLTSTVLVLPVQVLAPDMVYFFFNPSSGHWPPNSEKTLFGTRPRFCFANDFFLVDVKNRVCLEKMLRRES
jgi:hypothetical protein